MSSSSAAAAHSPPSKICFNSQCKETKSEAQRRKGWRLRSGEHADICDRCSLAYEQGTFCETFHLDAAGWRKCDSCGKRVHCGCIVSAHTYLLLDAGGIECIVCARKVLSMAQNSMWSPSLLLSSQVSERPKEHPVKSWSQLTGAFSGQWRQGPHLWSNGIQSDLQQRLSLEFDRPLHSERLISGVRPSISVHDKKVVEPSERLASSSLNHVVRNGTVGLDPTSTFNMYREEGKRLQDSCHHLGDNEPVSARKEPLTPSAMNGDSSPLLVGLAASYSSPNGTNDPVRVSMTQSQRQIASSLQKQQSVSPHNLNDASIEAHNGKVRVDARARAQILHRYRPRFTDEELLQISGDSNSVIMPLFEKTLSASDAGRIGRLVLPKRCAEAYFPTISQPEGLPLKVQDATGKEWVFQFRFWPNNNSRMYVLEGVTPCIQSMQLQAGDTVTFSRIDPEGKLVMGFRKASIVSSEQDAQSVKIGDDLSTLPEGDKNAADRNPDYTTDQNTLKFDKTGFIQKGGSASKSLQGPIKRKGSRLGSKSKRLRIENQDSIALKLTWEEAQELLRPPHTDIPNVVVIDGHEIEEYEEAPVLGKPTIFTTNHVGSSQWAQCEDCSKWRKLPIDALLPFRWTCSTNRWDPERSSCSSAQETSTELTDILPKTGSKRSKVKAENNDNLEVSDGLGTLANLAILGEGEAPSATTTRHPRHRPGCTCIVCIQPPSGSGPKHKPNCTCNVCITVKRRFQTLMMRREKRQSEKEAENAASAIAVAATKKEAPELFSCCGGSGDPLQPAGNNHEGEVVDDPEKRVFMVPSPLKGQIDLNIQPEREEEPSPVADAGGMTMPFAADARA